jgi:hypothetical protein
MSTWATVGYGYTTSGGFVGAYQSNLWASRFQTATGPVDESYGTSTRQGIIHFQNLYGLSPDGNVGPITRGQMETFTFTLDSNHRVFRNTSETYRVVYAGGSLGGANNYHLENTITGENIASGTMWIDSGLSFIEEPTNLYSTHKPSNQEIGDLDIPVTMNNDSFMSQQDPEILISQSGGIKNASAWIHTDTNPILISESTYEAGINVDRLVKEATSWHPSETVDVIDFKDNPTVVNDSGEGIYEIHIITKEKLFTLGGADKEVLLSIANEINFK